MSRHDLVRLHLAQYQEAFRLSDWDIRYNPDVAPTDKDASLALEPHLGAMVAILTVDPKVPESWLEFGVVHELAHVVIGDYRSLTLDVIAKTGKAGLGVMDHLATMEERICNRIAAMATGKRWEMYPCGAKKHDRRWAPFFIDEPTEVPSEHD